MPRRVSPPAEPGRQRSRPGRAGRRGSVGIWPPARCGPRPRRGARRAPGTCAASHSACANGTIMSSVPCQTATGTVMSPTAKPHGRSIVRSSSRQPTMPWAPARRNVAARQLGELAGQRGPVDRRSQRAQGVGDVVGGGREERRRVAPRAARVSASRPVHRGGELRDVLLAHAGAEVAVVLRRAATRPTPRDRGEAAAGQQRGAGQRPRAAAGPAERDELVEPEVVEDRGRRRRRRRRRCGGGAVRRAGSSAPYPGREYGDQPQPARRAAASISRVGHRALRRAVVEDEREARRRGRRPAPRAAAVGGRATVQRHGVHASRVRPQARASRRTGASAARVGSPGGQRDRAPDEPDLRQGPGDPHRRDRAAAAAGGRLPRSAAWSAATPTRPWTWPARRRRRASRASWWSAATAWCTSPCRRWPARETSARDHPGRHRQRRGALLRHAAQRPAGGRRRGGRRRGPGASTWPGSGATYFVDRAGRRLRRRWSTSGPTR